MAVRRPHRKSRHGCAECKRRRVKCDETRPTCSNCSKRQTECEYESASSLLWTNEERLPQPRSASSDLEGLAQLDSHLTPDNSFDILGRLGGDDRASQSPASLNLSDLELMMQWCNSTHQTLSRNTRTESIWRFRVPEEALSHTFLMHGILALSALHIARTRDDQRHESYVRTAVAHQHQALTFFRQLLNNITEDNAKAMFSFAGIVVVYTFGFPQTPDPADPWSCVDGLLQVLLLARGVQQLLNQATSWIRSTDWDELLQFDPYDPSPPDDARAVIQRLSKLNRDCGAQDPTHSISLYENVIENLADMMAAVSSGLTSVPVAARWAIKLRPEFVDLAREHRPFPLVILVHYCAVLHRLKYDWCFDQWDERVPKAIWKILDDSWRVHIREPMTEIFGQNFESSAE
ncbi:C6 zinc finger domain protein [Aspergillus campestris IBT 28561]|uniref:C6 zinc finger domain protein n=1 Tax=Aspergillus campestris (strain IBT 28561) TaxID=1392248 RepID=A0A2I1CSL0_ASPC2|nr:C6 zinc finger domain protein [Aspergillus campestris IBT 28561]PKY00601.1 C6 zinc finger domain protein [Aspergillus campestris IBT 28561]